MPRLRRYRLVPHAPHPRIASVRANVSEMQPRQGRNLCRTEDRMILKLRQERHRWAMAIQATAPEFFMAWRDCGLLDERGQARPAYAVWHEYFGRPLDPGR